MSKTYKQLKSIYDAGFDKYLQKDDAIVNTGVTGPELSELDSSEQQKQNVRSLRVNQTGTTRTTVNDRTDEGSYRQNLTEVTHDLGYQPLFQVFFKEFNGEFRPTPYQFTEFSGRGYEGFKAVHAYVDNKKLYIQLRLYPGITGYNSFFAYPVEYKYFIYQNKINE